MKGSKLLLIMVAGLGGLGVVYYLLNRSPTSTQVVQPGGSPTSHGKEEGILKGVAAIIQAAFSGGAQLAAEINAKDEQKVDDGDKENESFWSRYF